MDFRFRGHFATAARTLDEDVGPSTSPFAFVRQGGDEEKRALETAEKYEIRDSHARFDLSTIVSDNWSNG